MMRNTFVAASAVAVFFAFFSCGTSDVDVPDDQNMDPGPDDSAGVEDLTVPDPLDTIDTPLPDTPVEGLPDTEDPAAEPLPDSSSPLCELGGGYCTTYSTTINPCVLCPEVDGTVYKPARPLESTQGCTAEGTGTAAWCCVPVIPESSECRTSGGFCYAPSGMDPPCPEGWSENASISCPGSQVCCQPTCA